MARLAVAAVLVVVVVAAAWLIQRRRSAAAPTQASWAAPAQLDRADFEGVDVPWLVAVFTSSTCATCADMSRKAAVLASPAVAVQEVEVTARPELHRRYRIDAVPITVLADAEGVVRAAFVGPVSATDLWAAVAEAREPGSSPEPHLGH